MILLTSSDELLVESRILMIKSIDGLIDLIHIIELSYMINYDNQKT